MLSHSGVAQARTDHFLVVLCRKDPGEDSRRVSALELDVAALEEVVPLVNKFALELVLGQGADDALRM